MKEALTAARIELLAAAPDAASAAEAEAYLMRLMTASLDDVYLAHLRSERGLTRALPTRGAPNPDYIMWHAGIDSTRRYQLSGCLHDSERAGIGLYSFSATGVALLAGYAAFDRATADSDGCFSVAIAADAQGAGTITLAPLARVILVRVLHRVQGRACELTLEGGLAQQNLNSVQGSYEDALARAAQAALRAVRLFMQWSRVTSANPNCIIEAPPSMQDEVRGDPDTHYGLGYYELNEGEWLEALLPEGLTGYWSLHAYNHWCEALPGAAAHDLNVVTDPDGRIRVRIGPSVPAGLSNRIDTLSRRRGALIFRAIGATTTQLPQVMLRR
jgi:hypothetical protein